MESKDDTNQAPLETLEDLLIYDDLFLDYFNAFLSLPAFPQVLQYHRLTGTFQIVDSADDSLVEYSAGEPLYGATDEERERLIDWAQEERLPLFGRTELFREYKLCRLLLRPLDNRPSGTRPSTHVRGYSRHSSAAESLTDTDAARSDDDDDDETEDDDDDDEEEDEDELDTQALADDTGNDVSDLASSEATATERPVTQARSLPAPVRRRRLRRKVGAKVNDDDGDGDENGDDWTPQRSRSAPLSYEEFLRLPRSDLDAADAADAAAAAGRRPLVSFSARPGDPQLSDGDVRSAEARQNLGFDRLKELMLSTRRGVQEFIEFLRPTAGQHLVNFWLDCEYYRDTMSHRTDAENSRTRGRLLRDLQDRYRLRLTDEAKGAIRQAADDTQQANSVFLRTQYDVLRRLRSYWLPRFVIHKERELSGHTFNDLQQAWLDEMRRGSAASGLFPSLSLVNSMPVRPEVAKNLAETRDWDCVRTGGRRLDQRVRSARLQQQQQQQQQQQASRSAAVRSATTPRPFHQRLRDAMTVDRIAGGPFQQFLERRQEDELLACLTFFQEVEEYARRDERSSDRFLRLGHAWNIFNRYLNVGCQQRVGADQKEVKVILDSLRRARDIVPARIFERAQASVIAKMGDIWLRFLKDDVKQFLESSVSHRDYEGPPKTDEIQVTIENGKIVVRRLLPEKSRSELQTRRRSWDFLTEEEKDARRKAAAERNRLMEIERRKAVRAAKKRMKEMQQGGRKKNLKPLDEEESVDNDEPATNEGLETREPTKEDAEGRVSSKKVEEEEEVEKPPELKEMTKNRAVMALFKKFVMDREGRDMANALSLYQELQEFLQLPTGEKGKKKRDTSAVFLQKTYLDKNSKRRVDVTGERLQQRLAAEKDRPKTPTLKDVCTQLGHRLTEHFASFWQFQSEEMGVDMSALKNMSEKELRMRADLDLGASRRRGKKATGKATPTKDDKVEFLVALERNLTGALSLQMLHFYRYLMQYAVQDKVPNLEKNLFFYVESQKYKEFVQGGCDDEFLKRKIHVICSIFLESVFPPALQITISSDVYQRTLRNAQKNASPKHKEEISATIFDEAQFAVFKEMLPYWAGFMRQWNPVGKEYRPVSHQKRMLEERLQKIEHEPKPSINFKLPDLPANNNGPVSSLTLSLMEGIKWKDDDDRRARRKDMKTTTTKQQQ